MHPKKRQRVVNFTVKNSKKQRMFEEKGKKCARELTMGVSLMLR